jgi:FkbM family methyltransferase
LKKKYDPNFFDIAKPFLEQGGVYFDIGSNFGFCTFGIIGTTENFNIRYHLFEANPKVYEVLEKSIELHRDQKITINKCCVSNKNGNSKIRVVSKQLGMSYIDSEGDYEIENIVLDEYIKAHKIQKINFMKMDIEGWEPYAIQGSEESFRAGKIDALYIEISSKNLKRSQMCPQDFIKYLRSLELEIFYCKPMDILLSPETSTNLKINSTDIKVALVRNFPENYQTDLLAIHKSSGFL